MTKKKQTKRKKRNPLNLKDQTKPRREFIETNALKVRMLDI